MKDKRYTTTRNLIEGGFIKSFRDIFEVVPKSTMARDLGMNYMRFSRLILHVEGFFLIDIYRMASLLEIDNKKMLEMIHEQYLQDQKV